MSRKNNISVILITLTWICIGRAQFRFEKEIIPQAVREGVQFSAIVVNEFDDIYLLEDKFDEVYRLDQAGNVLNRNGGFGWGIGQFDRPSDICVSGLNIIIADQNNHRIVRYDRKLNYIATHDLRSDSRLLIYPISLASGQINEIFILARETAEIMRLFVERNEQTWFGGIDYGEYALDQPVSLRLNQKGHLAVLERDGSLLKYDRFGSPLGKIPSPAGNKSKINAIGLVAIQNDWLVLSDNDPGLQLFTTQAKAWSQPIFLDYDQSLQYRGAIYLDNRFYLLTKDGTILVFSHEQPNPKP